MELMFEYSDNGEDTISVINYGRYMEVVFVLANYDRETGSVLFHGELNEGEVKNECV